MRVFLSTADASGDLHAAQLLAALRNREPKLEAFGLGGASLCAGGFESIVAQHELAIAGLVEVLGRAPAVLGAYRRLRHALLTREPELAIFVDSPDLNLPLAAVAKRARVPVLYYVAPQVWAWRRGRVRKLARRTDRVAVIFPFEAPFLVAHGVRASFVGHPLVDRLRAYRAGFERESVARSLGLDPARPILGLLPGSRHNEVSLNLAPLLEAAELVRRAAPQVQVALVVAPTLERERFELPEGVHEIRGRSHDAMAVSTALLSAAGTATVEAALLGVPVVVAHRASPITFWLGRRLARVPSTAMLNLVAERGVVSERIQGQARPSALAALALELLLNREAHARAVRALGEAVARLGDGGAAERTAALALELTGRA